jgi:urease beta subunit
MARKMKRSPARSLKSPKHTRGSLAATIKAELAKPVVPGEILAASGEVEAFKGRETKELTVANVADRPIQVGSHCHFFESNHGLKFDREQAFGFRLAIPAGTAVRFEPGEEKRVTVVARWMTRGSKPERCRSQGSANFPEKEEHGEDSKKAICFTLRPHHG